MASYKSPNDLSPRNSVSTPDHDPETLELIQNMQKGTSNILVAVRCRPLTKKEKEIEEYKTVSILQHKLVVITDPGLKANKRTKEQQYAFDYAFDETISQQEVFNKTTYFLLDGVLNGFNATVFAYGPTGAGKTYTMLGEVDTLGIMLMSFVELFSRIENLSRDRNYSVRICYLEIYNEIVRDLLNPSNAFLDIREDPEKGIIVSGVKELNATSPEEVINCLRLGNRRRTCEPTEANMTSSRSHAVLQILVEYKDKATGTTAEVIYGKLSLIDLAGSERASNTKNRGLRLIEGANINKSLLALGNCINALYEANLKGIKTYIPYRDSKLTRLLKDSLGGNCRTVMIVCISPFYAFYEDTHNTLKYANRAKNIKTTTERNVVQVSYHVSKYTNIINDLKNEVNQLRHALRNQNSSPKKNESSDLYQKELDEHFDKENRARNSEFEAIVAWDDTNLNILIKENELNNARYKHPEDSSEVKDLVAHIEKLKSSLNDHESKIKKNQKTIKTLENSRKTLDYNWNSLPDYAAANLRIAMQQYIIKINEIEQQKNKVHDENLLRQKDLYIEMLQDQLKERIENLETQDIIKPKVQDLDRKIFSRNLKIDENKEKVFKYRLQGTKYSKNVSSLPPISPNNSNLNKNGQSKIPKYEPKYIEDNLSSSSVDINLIHPRSNQNLNKLKSNPPKKSKKKIFISNSEPESNRPTELPKISDKFKQSPYAFKKQDFKKNLYSKDKNIKYGVMLRGIEKL